MSRLTLHTPAKTDDEIICAAFTDQGHEVHSETVERLLQVPAEVTGAAVGDMPDAHLSGVMAERQTHVVARAQERLCCIMVRVCW